MLTLSVKKRDKTEAKASVLRSEGKIPSVVYGSTQESTAITIDAKEFEKILHTAGESTIISLTGLETDIPVLIHKVDLHPVAHIPRHVDFYAITKGQKVVVSIPLSFIGESPAVKSGANLIKVLYELEVEADPMNLPHDIEVDISTLVAINDQIHVKDLMIPKDVGIMLELEEVVALVKEVEEEVVSEVTEEDIASIEVEKSKEESPTEEVASA